MILLDSKTLEALSKRRHPDYETFEAHWAFLEATYEGGRAWFESNIHRYYKEGDNEFQERLERAYRFNHTREVVNLVNKYVFRGEIKRKDDAEPEIKKFWRAATRQGLTIEQFMRQVDLKTSACGRVMIVVDSTADGSAQTVADEKARDDRVYAYIVRPLDILDMSFDDLGDLRWVLVRETHRDDANPLVGSGDVGERFRLWTRDGWIVFENTSTDGRKKTYEITEEGTHSLKRVPAFFVDCMEISDSKYQAPALINDIAYLDRAVANYLSNLDAIIQDQTFSQLAIPAESMDEELGKKIVEMGTKRVFTYKGEKGAQPFFLSPDPKQAELIITAVKQIINEIYHTVGMAGERTKQDNAVGIDNSSGVAKAFDFERVNALLVAKAKNLQDAENRLVELVKLWHGQEDDDGVELDRYVSYPESFDVRGMTDELNLAKELALLAAPGGVQREQMKRLVEKMFPHLKAELKEAILTEIAEWPSDELMTLSAPGPRGKAKSEPKADGPKA